MNEYLGWIGLVLLLLAWCLELTKMRKHFFIVSGIASAILTIHAFLIKDIPFIIVNVFIMIISFIMAYKTEIKHKRL